MTMASNVADVFDYLCDVERWPEWAPTVLQARVRDDAPLQPGARVDQRAKGILGTSRGRSQEVTAVDGRAHAFAPVARWGMQLEPAGDEQTDATMWIEVDLKGVMRAIPTGLFKSRIQRVSDLEMVAIKEAVERPRSAP